MTLSLEVFKYISMSFPNNVRID